MKKVIFIIITSMFCSLIFAQDLYDIETINTIELTFEESNWDQLLDNLYAAGNEDRLLGSAVVNGVELDSVGVRYKGNSSYSPQNVKNPLNIKLDYVIDDQKYEGYGTLKLANGYNDPSFVRETLSYEIATNYMPISKANYTNVYINGNLIGLYTSVQSVDKYFKNSNFPGAEDIRFKGELLTGANPTVITVWGYMGADSTDYTDYYELKSDTGWDELIEFLDVFNNNSTEMENYLNVDNHLWMLAFDNLLVNLDAPINFGHNYYLFKDASDRFNPIVWDLNENFGVFSMLISGGPPMNQYQMQTLDPLLNLNNSDYPIIGKVLNIDNYQKMYIAHMRTMIEEVFQSGWYESRANELQDIIDADYQSDPNTFYSYSQFQQNINSTVTTGGPGGSSIIGLTELMDTRYEWLLNQSEFQGDIPSLGSVTYSPQIVTPNSTVWFNVDAEDTDDIWLNYRILQDDKFAELEMLDDGNHNDGAAGDGTYGASLESGYQDIEYYFYAQNNDLGAFLPVRAAYEFYELDVTTETGDIIINEINYNSSDDFDSEDWVELYNPGTDDLDLSGWEFKDEDDDHIFTILGNVILAGDEYLVLCNDSALFSAAFQNVDNFIGDFDFGLSGGGEAIRLFDAEGTLVDSVNYDDEDPWPLEPDGNGPTLELIDPTFDNNLAENWQASVGYGTPGEQNSTGSPVSDDIVINNNFKLQNYPNPFNPTTTISFSLTERNDNDIKLEIYNLRGQKVKTFKFPSGTLEASEQNVVWNGTDDNNKSVSSGIYFYQLQTRKHQETRKMILMK